MTIAAGGDSVIVVERVESGEFSVTLGRLIPVDVATCADPTTGSNPMDPTAVIGAFDSVILVIADDGMTTVEGVESRAFAAVLERLTPVDSTDCTNPETE